MKTNIQYVVRDLPYILVNEKTGRVVSSISILGGDNAIAALLPKPIKNHAVYLRVGGQP